MANNFLAFGALVAFGWAFANVPLPKEAARPAVSRVVKSEAAPVLAERAALGGNRAPVPLVRSAQSPVATPAVPATSPPVEDAQAQDGLDRGAAKAVIEADGYKRVSVLGKGVNGSWRARAYRGTTEVELTVDGTGRVSAE